MASQEVRFTTCDVLELVIGFALLAIIVLVLRSLRLKVYESSIFGHWQWLQNLAKWIEDKVEYIFVIGPIGFVAIAVFLIVVGSVGFDYVLEGIVLSFAALTVYAFQLPRLLKPSIFVVPMVSPDGESIRSENSVRNLSLPRAGDHLIGLQVANLGLNHYEGLTVWVSFSRGLQPLLDDQLYENVDFAKRGTYQRGNNCVFFGPEAHLVDLAPAQHIVFALIVRASDSPGEEWIDVEVACRTRWKAAVKRLAVRVE